MAHAAHQQSASDISHRQRLALPAADWTEAM